VTRFPKLIVRIAASLLLALSPAAAVASPVAIFAPQQASQAVTAQRGLRTVEVGLNHLLDRYAQPIEASGLLQAAWDGALEVAQEIITGEIPQGAFPADRAAAWKEFEHRFTWLTGAGADPGALAQEANRAMARSLDDCHTRFARSYESEIASVNGRERYSGIGATALDPKRFQPLPPGPVIVDLFESGPALAAGVRPGDAVIGVDAVDTTGFSSRQVVELIRGATGTSISLRLDRLGEVDPVEITIDRAEIEVPLVKSRLIQAPDDALPIVGYIQFRGFTRSVESALPEVLDQLYEQGARGWVLDLRQNGGGALATFIEVASLFVEQGILGVTVDRSGAETLIQATGANHKAYATPLALLVSGMSASASELLTADLQEYGVAVVFGETTAGCFGTSQLFRLPDGSGLWITVRALQSGVARRDVHKSGVTPDVVVPLTRSDLASGADPQLEAAVAWLRAFDAMR
jgi:carboxyl-terminal processing protease